MLERAIIAQIALRMSSLDPTFFEYASIRLPLLTIVLNVITA